MSGFSYFHDKLSPETRVIIYGFVFGDCKHVTRRALTDAQHSNGIPEDERVRYYQLPSPKRTGVVAIHADIFAVDKQVSAEALETFYNAKTLRLRFEEFADGRENDYFNFVRRLEFVDCLASVRQYGRDLLHAALRTASHLPRLKSVRILSDCLAYAQEVQDATTVRDFVESFGLGELTCVDVGQYRLSTDHGDCTIANSKLLRLWPSVANKPADYDAKAEAIKLVEDWRTPRFNGQIVSRCYMAWASHTSLRLWVGLFEQLMEAKAQEWVALRDEDGSEYQVWCDMLTWCASIKDTENVSALPRGRDAQRVPMHKLGPSHDAESLEWATELLAMNIETYVTANPTALFGQAMDAKACWPELEGGECVGAETGRVNAEAHASNMEWRRRNYVQSPVDDSVEYSVIGLKRGLAGSKSVCSALCIRDSDLDVADDTNNEEVKKVFRLSVALTLSELHDEGGTGTQDRRQALDRWSHTLLCKYLRSITYAADGVFEDWGLGELRDLCSMFIRMLEQRLVDVFTMPGAFPVGDEPFDNGEGRYELDALIHGDEEVYRPFVKKAAKAWRLLCLCTPAADEAGEGADTAGWADGALRGVLGWLR